NPVVPETDLLLTDFCDDGPQGSSGMMLYKIVIVELKHNLKCVFCKCGSIYWLGRYGVCIRVASTFRVNMS
ncbi:hypothetical protein ACG93W_18825, partial [Acinetobacter baumannii]|uniref:hypothetical protein n=1 Tax=Acinetobacter baumannii TaxID=470 RepID=UPI003AF57CF6